MSITGYREINAEELALINEAKALAEQCGAFCARLSALPRAWDAANLPAAAGPAIDGRWLAIGQTDLQRGWMSVIRSIARPTTF